MGPNGEVLYWSSGFALNLFNNGTTTTLVTLDPDQGGRAGVTDGVNVCYGAITRPEITGTRQFYIRAITGSGIETLAVFDLWPEESEPVVPCLVNGGWIAYLKPASGGAVQAWVRSPSGLHTQASFFSGHDRLEDLSPQGRLVFISPAAELVRQRYLWTPGGSASEISSGLGRPRFIDAQLHVIMGSALLRVN